METEIKRNPRDSLSAMPRFQTFLDLLLLPVEASPVSPIHTITFPLLHHNNSSRSISNITSKGNPINRTPCLRPQELLYPLMHKCINNRDIMKEIRILFSRIRTSIFSNSLNIITKISRIVP